MWCWLVLERTSANHRPAGVHFPIAANCSDNLKHGLGSPSASGAVGDPGESPRLILKPTDVALHCWFQSYCPASAITDLRCKDRQKDGQTIRPP